MFDKLRPFIIFNILVLIMFLVGVLLQLRDKRRKAICPHPIECIVDGSCEQCGVKVFA